jgi:hypothetical protein
MCGIGWPPILEYPRHCQLISLVPMPSPGLAVGGLSLALPSRGDGHTRNVLPDLEVLGHFLAIRGRGESVASRAEVLRDGTIRGEKPLGVPWRLEPLHPSLPLACGLMRVFWALSILAPQRPEEVGELIGLRLRCRHHAHQLGKLLPMDVAALVE